MRIRKVVKADAEELRALRLRALQTNPEAFASAYKESAQQTVDDFRQRIPEADSDNAIFVAEVDGKLVGMAGLGRVEQSKMQHKAWVWGVYIEPEMRGQGIARGLMDQVIDHARQVSGLQQVLLNVVTTNAAALKLYQSYGFEIWGTEPAALLVNGALYDEHYMILRLNAT